MLAFFLPPDTHMYVCVSGVKKCWFFGKFGVLRFHVTSVLRFALLFYYRRNVAAYLHSSALPFIQQQEYHWTERTWKSQTPVFILISLKVLIKMVRSIWIISGQSRYI